MSTSSKRPGPAASRRAFVVAASAGCGGLALGGLGFAAASILAQDIQIGGTPAAPPVPTPTAAAGETIEDVAARLGYERDALIAFVRDEIRYEAYAGILRGANGTLRARAGNSADQAALLGALLDAAQISHRFAIGSLDAAGETALTGVLSRASGEVRAAWEAADTAAMLHHLGVAELPATSPPLDPAIEARLNEIQASAQQAVDLALASAELSVTAIGDALASAGVSLPPLGVNLTERERLQHTWIQIADGPDWIDADPSLPEGVASPAASGTLDTLPDDMHHWLRFVIAADEWRAGSVRQREVVSLRAASSRLGGIPVALSMASAGELDEAGLTINRGLTGQQMVYPSIYADGVTVNTSVPLMFQTDAAASGSPFGDARAAGIGEGETVAVWLRVEISSPDAEMVAIERSLLDRVPPEDRAASTFAPERIQPLRLVPTDIGDDTVDAFNVVTIIHTDVARISPTAAFVRYSQDELFGSLGVLGPALAGFRDILGATLEAEAGYWSYPSAPNVTVFHAGAPDGDSLATIRADLLHRVRTSLPLIDVTPAAGVHPLVLSGVLDAVAEQLSLAPETRGETGETPSVDAGPAIATVFAEAAAAGVQVRVVSRVDDLAAIVADPLSRRWMETALASGQVVVVPEMAVELGGTPVLGWWIVDPVTGRTRDQLSTGMAGAATAFRIRPEELFDTAPGWTFLLRAIAWVKENARHFVCLGGGILWGAVFVRRAMRERLAGDAEGGDGAQGPTAEDLVVGGVAGGSAAISCYMGLGG
jgi:hypothetical protein